jgi:hypothetical protein
MSFRYLKKTLVFSVLAAGVFIFALSCDSPLNPFATNLGAKVPIEPPVVTVTSPGTGEFLKGDTVIITGETTAYRQLRDVKVRAIPDSGTFIPNFRSVTSFSGSTWTGSDQKRTFSFVFDSTGLEDGPLKVQFQVSDAEFPAVNGTEYQYIVKNKPSVIKITNPNTVQEKYPSEIADILQGQTLMVDITDVRGIKPGYPQIQIWKDTDTEPNVNTGNWYRMFISGWDNTDSWIYRGDNRNTFDAETKITAMFKLGNFTAGADDTTYHSGANNKLIQYVTGDLPNGNYRFRIRTYETYFDKTQYLPDGTKNTNYWKPCPPPPGEEELIQYEPAYNLDASGNPTTPVTTPGYHTINVTTKAADTIKISFNNDDVTAAITTAKANNQPYIYIDAEPETSKVIVSAAEKPNSTQEIFRLQIDAFHNDGVDSATLTWNDGTNSGTLNWDNGANGTQVVGGSDATKTFTYTAKNTGNPFVSGKRYRLTVTALPVGDTGVGDPRRMTKDYYVSLEEGGPVVTILEVKGMSAPPTGDPVAVVPAGTDDVQKSGTINKYAYTVNDNIQITQYSAAKSGINRINDQDVVKYFVELADVGDVDGEAHLTKTNILLNQLINYRKDPASPASRNFLQFFNGTALSATLGGLTVTVERRGLTNAINGTIPLRVDMRTVNAGVKGSIPSGITTWNDRYVWLYIVAQDSLNNLGYTVQKLKVDDSGDIPVLTLQDGLKDSTEVASPGALYAVPPGADDHAVDPVSQNVLRRYQSINFNLTDDDGIRVTDINNTNFPISVTLNCLNLVSPAVTVTLTEAELKELLGEREFKDQSVGLSQKLLGSALWRTLGAGARRDSLYPLNSDGERPNDYLPDGLYTLTIRISDALSEKVSVTGLAGPGRETITRTIHFAVQSAQPAIDYAISDTADGAEFLTGGKRNITGTVKSRLKIQWLDMSFQPDIYSTAPGSGKINLGKLPLYAAAGSSTPLTDWNTHVPDSSGLYTYYWKVENVDFGRADYAPVNDDGYRSFEIRAYDAIGVFGGIEKTVKIDNTPPKIDNLVFNFGRKDLPPAGDANAGINRVNGKILLEVEIDDANGVETDANGNPSIRWFIVPDSNTAFVPTYAAAAPAGGRRVQFTADDHRGGTRYRTVIDTTAGTNSLTDLTNYKFYVIARDKAGNLSNDDDPATTQIPPAPELGKFRVVQDTDNPRMESISPSGLPRPPFTTTANNTSNDLQNNTRYFTYADHGLHVGETVVVAGTRRYVLWVSGDNFKLSNNYTLATPATNVWNPVAGNITVTPETQVTVGGVGAELIISGKIFDDDGFNPATAVTSNTYVAIRFPAQVSGAWPTVATTGGTVTQWGDWIPIDAAWRTSAAPDGQTAVNDITGNVDFIFDYGNNTPPAYLAFDSQKQYQLRVIDELDRGSGDAASGYQPEGKNPDLYKGDGTLRTSPPPANITRRTMYFPGNTAGTGVENTPNNISYKFTLKNTDPEIYFYNYDPDDTHTPYYTENRPSFGGADGQAALLNALSKSTVSGATTYGGEIRDISLKTDTVYFTLGATRTLLPVTETSTGSGVWRWAVTDTMLASYAGLQQGVRSAYLEASDTLGNTTKVEWSFSKDSQGPVISFDNISESIVRTVSGVPRTFTTTANNTSNDLQNNTRYFEYANHGLQVGETVVVAGTRRYVLWVGGPDNNRFKLSAGAAVWNPGAGNITVNTVGTVITGRFLDDYSDIDATMGYQFDALTTGWGRDAAYNIVNNNGTIDGNAATWQVPVDPTGTFDGAFPDGVHYFSITAKDQWGNATSKGNGTTTVKFVIDRKEPQMITLADNGTGVTNRMIVKGNKYGPQDAKLPQTGVYLPANERVLSAAAIVANGYNVEAAFTPTGGDTWPTKVGDKVVFTLSGLVYEHNLNTLRAAIRNNTNSKASPTLNGIDASAVAWNKGGTVTAWFYGRNAGDTADFTAIDNNFRVRRAANGDFGLSGAAVATYQNRYVWELDIRERDLFALTGGFSGADKDDGIKRVIAVTARDLANFDSITEEWSFYLDSAAPAIEDLNLNMAITDSSTSPLPTLLESPTITLTGTVRDSTPIQKIEYKIEKFDYGTSAWVVKTTGAGGFDNYAPSGIGVDKRITLSITDAAVIDTDGYYRVTIRASDWSIPGGNSAATGPVYFRVDRKDPELKWGIDATVTPNVTYGTPVKEFYKWEPDGPDYQIALDFTALDDSTFDPAPEGKLYLTSNSAKTKAVGTDVAVTFTSVNAASSKVNVKITATAASDPLNLIQGRYTLELIIKDKAGKRAVINETVTFFIDNKAPVISITNLGTNNTPAIGISNEALTGTGAEGKVEFRAKIDKDTGASKVRRVAYQINTGTVTAPATFDDAALKAAGWFFEDNTTTSPYKLWVKAKTDGSDPRPAIAVGTVSNTAPPTNEGAYWSALIEINNGLATPTLTLYNPRLFINIKNAVSATTLLGAAETAASGITYKGIGTAAIDIAANGNNVYGGDQVNKLRIYLLAIDESDNVAYKAFDYWIYPAGDYPQVQEITSPSTSDPLQLRQLNGTIKISGTAEDNYRVSKVWFRILKDGYTANGGVYPGGVGIPIGYEPAVNLKEQKSPTATTLPGYGTGWYEAESGVNKTVMWYAQINGSGELDPTGNSSSRGIIVQAIAEDAVWDASLDDGIGGYTTSGNLLSSTNFTYLPLKQVEAFVVSGTPTFTDEKVKSSASDSAAEWNDINRAAVNGRSSYQVTVKHHTAVTEIRWTSAPTGVSSTANLLNSALGTIAANGITAKAEPLHTLASGDSLVNGDTYMILEPFATPVAGLTAETNKKYYVFEANAAVLISGTAKVMKMQADGNFEWLITVDMNTTQLGFTGNKRAGYYDVSFEAHDNSKTVALFSRKIAQVPVDSLPPKGVYTYNTKVVGNASFGGEAEDAATNPDGTAAVNGLSRVVLWFSRKVGGVETSIVWNEKRPGLSPTQRQFNNTYGTVTGTTTIDGDTIGNWNGRNTAYTNVVLPYLPAESLASGNNTCIIIDRQDPMGNQGHHGHHLNWTDDNLDGAVNTNEEKLLSMGWAKNGGQMETSWYVALNSALIESGRVTAHYIVYDHAGNGTYYNQSLMILNGVARISSVTLATDIYGAYSPLNLQELDGDTGTYNLKFGKGATLVSGTNGSAITLISDRFDDNDVKYNENTNPGGITAVTNAEKGISEEIPIDTSSPGVYSVVFDQKDFMARNNLLAIKVDTLVPQSSEEKDRYYRVEYVSGVVNKTGFAKATANSLTNQTSGVRAGRVYIINDPGTNFPWGVLGAEGVTDASGATTYRRGLVFLALQDGYDLDVSAGGYGSPSAWELNGSYYTGANPLTRNVPTNLQFTGGDVKYKKLNDGVTGQGIANELGMTAEFVYRANAFTATGAGNAPIRDFSTNGGANLDVQGRPLAYPASATQVPDVAHSLFIIRVFDGVTTTGTTGVEDAEAELFGDFALLSIRVNNNDVTPPYAQLYDLNPKTEDALQTDALDPQGMGENRTRGGLYKTGDADATDPARSGHIEPRKTTSLNNIEMGGARTASITTPIANTAAYFDIDTVSGDVIVRGYAEDNQRIARVDIEFWSTVTNSARLGAPVTILTRNKDSNRFFVKSALSDRVQFTETADLNRHRVEWAYKWTTDDLPFSTGTTPLVVGNINVRAVAYNANTAVTGTAAGDDPVNSVITAQDRIHTSPLLTWANPMANLNRYDDFNIDFPESGTKDSVAPGNYYRYNQIRVNIRPYITGFLRNQGDFAHNIRSRQGWYILRTGTTNGTATDGEIPAITGFNLGGPGTTNLYYTLRNATTGVSTTQTQAFGAITANTQRDNYVVNTTHRGLPAQGTTPDRVFTTRYRIGAAMAATAATGEGKIELVVNGYSAVNTPALITGRATNETDNNPRSIRPLIDSKPVVQPWNKEYNPDVSGSELWDDYTMLYIWRSDDYNGAAVDRGRFVKGNFEITNPSMSIDPTNGRLWASHQEGGRRPTWTTGGNNQNIYPGGGAYISNNSSTMPYDDPDRNFSTTNSDTLLRQVGSFSEHMTYTNMYVDNSSRVWAITNSITKYNAADRWRFLPGMWLWGPLDNDNNNNGNPMISHFPRTYGGDKDNYQRFRFPRLNGTTTTGMYAVESLWYNGSNNSRTKATPQSTEQFHNPHVVATTDHVHVSYYDSKDGSLKYRYNSVGTTGVVHNEESHRNWVNLDGGADVDDNSDATSAPGKSGVGDHSVNYIGIYDEESAHNPNGTESPTSSAYVGGATHAFGIAGTINTVYVQNGSYVTTNDNIFRVGTVDIKAPVNGFIVLGQYGVGENATVTGTMCRIYPVVAESNDGRIKNPSRLGSNINAGRYNSIAVTATGRPVIAYYDETNQRFKLAVSNSDVPTTAAAWAVHDSGGVGGLLTANYSRYISGTGEHISLQIDTQVNVNRFHIAAMNAVSKNVVYITGTITGSNAAVDNVQIIDSVSNVGSWCKLSLDKDGNPWIAYMDEGYKGSKDGVKVAYYMGDTKRNNSYKYTGATTAQSTTYRNGDIDPYGRSIAGWEYMHVPTRYRVENDELGMERWPTIRLPNQTRTGGLGGGSTTKVGFAAVGFRGEDYYRIAYYIE